MAHAEKPACRTGPHPAGSGTELLREASFADPRSVGIVHDLGNLIQVASSAISLIARSPGIAAAHELDPLVAGARSALERAGVIVRQTIRSARDGSGLLEHVDVTACLAEIGDLTRHMWSARRCLEISTSSDTLAVTCNRLAFQNAILNLLINARDAMPKGGTIAILATEFPNGRGGADIEVRVMDNGVGMTPETAARVFDPYFTTKASGSGGVGLPMVKRFAEDAGGSVEIDSQPGVGTTVRLRLPAATAMSAALATALNSASRQDATDEQAAV